MAVQFESSLSQFVNNKTQRQTILSAFDGFNLANTSTEQKNVGMSASRALLDAKKASKLSFLTPPPTALLPKKKKPVVETGFSQALDDFEKEKDRLNIKSKTKRKRVRGANYASKTNQKVMRSNKRRQRLKAAASIY